MPREVDRNRNYLRKPNRPLSKINVRSQTAKQVPSLNDIVSIHSMRRSELAQDCPSQGGIIRTDYEILDRKEFPRNKENTNDFEAENGGDITMNDNENEASRRPSVRTEVSLPSLMAVPQDEKVSKGVSYILLFGNICRSFIAIGILTIPYGLSKIGTQICLDHGQLMLAYTFVKWSSYSAWVDLKLIVFIFSLSLRNFLLLIGAE